ncbi:MAG: hypothetical protein NUV77_02855 [Thermoguttaceae bacterium]|jgi:hypothetical protein|nr:hypothetical protein [Thermoguttaceae bacterium]
MATIIDVANAVVTQLNSGAFSQLFTAQRLYRPQFDLSEMKTLHVTVVPKALAINSLSRGSDSHEYQIDVAVQKKFETESSEELDPLVGLVEEIADHFRTPRLASLPSALCVKVENKPIYAQEHFDEMRQFTSIITLTFRVAR